MANPFDLERAFGKPAICICSYEFAARKEAELQRIPWDLVVMDEAHKLRNVYKSDGAKTAKVLDNALMGVKKVLLSATPLQNSMLELFGLVSIIDPHFLAICHRLRLVMAVNSWIRLNWRCFEIAWVKSVIARSDARYRKRVVLVSLVVIP